MPVLVLKETGEQITVAPGSLADALASGLYEAPAAGTQAQVSTPAGLADVPIEQLGQYQQSYGDPLATSAEVGAAERATYLDRAHGGAAGTVGTFVEQAADTATLGLYGVASDAIAGDDYTEARAERLEANQTAGAAGTVVGAVAPALLSGGAGAAGTIARATPAGGAARIAEAIVAKGAGKGLAAETAAAAAGYGVEGALFGSGHVLAETVLHDKELSAEAFIAGATEGALWGGAAGGAGSLLSRGTRFAKNKLDDVMAERASLKDLAAEQKAAAKAAEADAKALSKLKLENERHLNRVGMEELRQEGRLKLVDARSTAKQEGIDAATEASKELAGYTAEQKLKLEEYRLGGRKELAEIGADARLKLADRALEKEVAKAEARVAVSRAKLDSVSERLAIEQERSVRAKLVMDGRLEIADTYTGGWKRAAESREAVAASKLEAAAIGADARTRVGLADALVKSGRSDAGLLVEEMIPARLRTPKAVAAAKADVVTQAARLQATTDDLVRQADELIALNPAAAEDLASFRAAAAESAPAVAAWSAKAAGGADDFVEGFKTIRGAEQAQHDLAQAMRMQAEAAGLPTAQFDEVAAGMDDAVGKTDDIVTTAMAKQVEAATGAASGRAAIGDKLDAAGVADMLIGMGGLPNADDIPVIGPVLGAYLKFRAAHGALGKLGIRLPGPIGRIAQVGTQTQNKAGEVVAAIVARAPAAAKVAERAAPSLTSTLSRPLWEPLDSDRPAPGSGQIDQFRLYKKRIEELDRAMGDPDGTRQKIIDSIPAPPTVAAAIADAEMRKLEYLHSLVDVDPRAPTIAGKPAPANRVEVQRFAEAKRAVENPVESIKDFIDGRSGAAVVDAVRTVFPRLFASMQEQLVEKVAESDQPIAFSRLVRAALVFDVPLTHATTAEYGFNRQAEYAEQKAAAQQPSAGGGQLRLSQNEELGSMRRAMR